MAEEYPFGMWEYWVESMEDRGITIPDTLTYRATDKTETECETRHATLDQLSSAIVFMEEEIERLHQVKAGMLAIQARARWKLCTGETQVHRALGLN